MDRAAALRAEFRDDYLNTVTIKEEHTAPALLGPSSPRGPTPALVEPYLAAFVWPWRPAPRRLRLPLRQLLLADTPSEVRELLRRSSLPPQPCCFTSYISSRRSVPRTAAAMDDANKRKPDDGEGAAAPERKRRRWDTAEPAAAAPAASAQPVPAAVRERPRNVTPFFARALKTAARPQRIVVHIGCMPCACLDAQPDASVVVLGTSPHFFLLQKLGLSWRALFAQRAHSVARYSKHAPCIRRRVLRRLRRRKPAQFCRSPLSCRRSSRSSGRHVGADARTALASVSLALAPAELCSRERFSVL